MTKTCIYKNCQKEFKTYDHRQQFCSKTCGAKNRNTVWSKESRAKAKKTLARKYLEDPKYSERMSASLIAYYKNNENKNKGEKHSKAVGKATKGKFNANPNNLYELSGRTRLKIIRRLNLKCSQCGWNEDVCDIHHINGKKIHDPHNHKNLCILCPNCHRLAHKNKIEKEKLKNLEDQIGLDWKQFYYG